jgi:hypothetical protein
VCKLLLSSQKDFQAIAVVVVEGYLFGLDVDFCQALKLEINFFLDAGMRVRLGDLCSVV